MAARDADCRASRIRMSRSARLHPRIVTSHPVRRVPQHQVDNVSFACKLTLSVFRLGAVGASRTTRA